MNEFGPLVVGIDTGGEDLFRNIREKVNENLEKALR
jgi:fumarate hydratase subunit beta